MRNTREAVAEALLAQLRTVVFSAPVTGAMTWRDVSRKMKLFSDVLPAQRPVLFIADHSENSINKSENTPGILTMSFNLFVYTNGRGQEVPATDINVILDAIDAALAPDYTGKQTLGGLVSHCRVDGETRKDPGDLDGDGLVWVPIKVFGP